MSTYILLNADTRSQTRPSPAPIVEADLGPQSSNDPVVRTPIVNSRLNRERAYRLDL